MRALALAPLLAVAVLTGAGPVGCARGRPGPARPAPRLAVDDAEAMGRLARIAPRLWRAQADTRTWWLAWAGLMAGGTALQASLLGPIDDRAWRIDLAVGTVGTAVALVPLALTPARTRDPFDRLQAALATEASAAGRLRAAEAILAGATADAEAATGWLPHVTGDAAAIALGLVQILAFDHLRAGLFTAIGGTLGNTILVLTRPTAAVAAWEDYRAAWASTGAAAPPAPPAPGVAPRLTFVPLRAGLGVSIVGNL